VAAIMHISDLHFGWAFVPHVAQALQEFAHQLQPDLIVASGDFTQQCRPEEFAAARDFLGHLPDVPRVVTPGNHDVPPWPFILWQFPAAFALYRQYIHPELNYHQRLPDVVVVSLNSTSSFGSMVNGWISQEQIDSCARVFADTAPETLRVVVAHHSLAPVPRLRGGGVMFKAERAIEHLTALKVDLILGGHKHRCYFGNSLDFYTGKDREHGIIIVQCGTSTSRRGRGREKEKNTFNVIHWEEKLIRVTQYMYFKEVSGFEITAHHIFPRAGARYVARDVRLQSFGARDTPLPVEKSS
jgi:3',5'-cyclic AMP phosphodiesterase CpdA